MNPGTLAGAGLIVAAGLAAFATRSPIATAVGAAVGRPATVLSCELRPFATREGEETTHLQRFHFLSYDETVAESVLFTSHLGGPIFARPQVADGAPDSARIQSSFRSAAGQVAGIAIASGGDEYEFEIHVDSGSRGARVVEVYRYADPRGPWSGVMTGEYACREFSIVMPEEDPAP